MLSGKPMTQPDAWRMIRRRTTAAGIAAPIGCHTFRATGIPPTSPNGLHHILSGTGANTVASTTTERGPGSLIYEPFGLVHQWGNPGNEPLTLLAIKYRHHVLQGIGLLGSGLLL